MSEESKQPDQQQAPQQPQKRKDAMIYGVIIAILIVIIVYLMINRHNMTQQNQQTSSQLVVADSSRSAIENDYNAALARLDQLTSKNAQMDSMITDKNGEVAKLKSQIRGILSDSRASASQLRKAKELIEELNTKTKSYEERIAELEGQNNQLTSQNQSLSKERDSTANKNAELKQLGSVLHASNIRLEPIHLKRGGKKEKETSKARKVDVLRIMFDIDENRIAENGTKELDVRIVDPNGSLLSNAAYGSGTTTASDGSSMNYTIMKQVALETNKPVKDVTVDWHQDSDYKKGQYQIEIYNGGYKIGSGSVKLH